jgi:two-component system, OmpR family, response regulator
VRILILEDDLPVASFISKGFKENNFAVDHAVNGEDGLHLALTETYDAAIVDIMLPKIDGLTVIERIRRAECQIPILILSARGSVEDRVKGIRIGGDDYLTKPFAFSELLVRIQALIRRSHHTPEPERLTVGDLVIDLIRHEVTRAGQVISLQPREFALLEYLARNAGKAISKTMILEHIWDFDFDPQTNVVDVSICRLRNKVDRRFPEKLIHTLHGVGYTLKIPSAS